MKVNFVSLVAGVFLAVSGSLLASSVTVPFVFSSGQKAKASDINSNFTALANAINGIDGRVSSIESKAGVNKSPIGFSVSQTDMPVGSKVTVNGTEYTIAQFEFPRFDTDDVYIIKFPAVGDFSTGNNGSNGNVYAQLSVQGAYTNQEISALDSPNFTVNNGINGFPTFGWESPNYSASLSVSGSGRSFSTSFSQHLSTHIFVGDKTKLSLYLSAPIQTKNASSPIRSADATAHVPVYPNVKISSEREQIRQNTRQLLSYVVIKKK